MTPLQQVSPKMVSRARETILQQVASNKRSLLSLIQGGSRDWEVIREMLAQYIDTQTAADVLGGMTQVSIEYAGRTDKGKVSTPD